jgi:osmotically-inducible protein OsmY
MLSAHSFRFTCAAHFPGYTWAGCCSLAMLAQLAGSIPAWADVTPPAATQSDSDRRLTSEVRQALEMDIDLGTYNLGASVRDNVATIWGTVPSKKMSERALALTAKVPGVGRVINQLSIESVDDPLTEFLKLPARSLTPNEVPGRTPMPPAEEKKSVRTAHGPVPVWHPAPELKPAPRGPEPVAPEPPTLPAIPLPTLQAPAVPTPSVRPAAATSTGDLDQAIAALQHGNDRIRGVKSEIRGGAVFLRGSVSSWDDLFAFARGISRLPGVERVVIDGVKTAAR